MIAQAKVREHPIYPWLSRIKGVGEKTIARLIKFIDIKKLGAVSELIALAGLTNRDEEENVKLSSRLLQGVCFDLSMNLLRARGKFFDYYMAEKEKITQRLEAEGKKIVSADNLPRDARGRYIKTEEFISKDLVRHRAREEMIRLFLTLLWIEWERVKGLSTKTSG